jgi:DNA-binding GntR family transcriptional regulator
MATVVDDDVARLMSRGKWREAHLRLQHAVALLEQATRTPRPDSDAIDALAARWRSQARVCMDRHLGLARRPFRDARADHRDSG